MHTNPERWSHFGGLGPSRDCVVHTDPYKNSCEDCLVQNDSVVHRERRLKMIAALHPDAPYTIGIFCP
jgi:hypothetical protein